MGHAGVEAIKQNLADGYWGNGMRVALGEKAGVAKLHLDLRRGDGPPGARWYNFAALTTTERMIEEQPQAAAAAVRRSSSRKRRLRPIRRCRRGSPNDCSPEEVPLIAGLIARDAPFYDAAISPEAVEGLSKFAMASGLTTAPVSYEQVVATQFRELWSG